MTTTKFDIADYLDNEDMIAEYLNTLIEDGDNKDLKIAIGQVANSIKKFT